MSDDTTTTIQITQEQREALRSVNDGSAKAAVSDLLEAYDGEDDSTVPAALSYDDVLGATRQALREELPQEALQG